MAKNVLTLPVNTKGRDFVVGDIHGIFDVLDAALIAVNFDPACDRLISVGDLIDRGPQSHKVLDYLGQPWFHAIRGNHEDLFLYCMRDGTLDRAAVLRNLRNGFDWMLEQTPEHLLAIKAAFEKLPVALQIEAVSGKTEDRIGFVHADIPAGMSWDGFLHALESGDKDIRNIAQWGRERIDNRDVSGVPGISRIFLGHTPQLNAQQLGNCFFIDTGGVYRARDKHTNPLFYLSLIETTVSASAIIAPHLLPGHAFRVIQKSPTSKKVYRIRNQPPRP